MTEKNDLLNMGFDEQRIDWAIKSTNNGDMEKLLDHLESHAEEAVPENIDTVISDIQPQSIKCDDCNKLFKDSALAGYHAEKSGHSNFSQSTESIKPLTEEEKAQRLTELKVKMEEKRKKQAEDSKIEDKQNEVIRQQRGKEEMAIREELKMKEVKKDLEKKKKEKEDDKKAMAKVKAQIEQDKKERAEKAAKEKALREGKFDEAKPAPKAPVNLPKVNASNATETRLQLRTPNGNLITTKNVQSTLKDLRDFVSNEQGIFGEAITFSTTFPAKTFQEDEINKTLKELNLIPSAALIVKY